MTYNLEPGQVEDLLATLKGENDASKWITRLSWWLDYRDKKIRIWNHCKEWFQQHVRDHETYIYIEGNLMPYSDAEWRIDNRVHHHLEYAPYIWSQDGVIKNKYGNGSMLSDQHEQELLAYLNEKMGEADEAQTG